MRVVGDGLAVLGVAFDDMRNDVGVAIDPQRRALKRDHLLRPSMVEVEHVVRLALEEQRSVAIWFKLVPEPEVSPLPCSVPVAAHEVGVAVQRMRRPPLQQLAVIVEPVELRAESATNGDLIRRPLLPTESSLRCCSARACST